MKDGVEGFFVGWIKHGHRYGSNVRWRSFSTKEHSSASVG